LPMADIDRLLQCLRRYFLLGQGEFAVALIDAAEDRLQARQQSMGRLLQQDPVKALRGLSMKDNELHQTLSAAWKALTSEGEDDEDNVLDFARKHLLLCAPNTSAARPLSSDSVSSNTPQPAKVDFNDSLFPSATILSMHVQSPLDLFLTPADIDRYATINAYLVAIRRTQVRLSNLWRRTSARRQPSGQKAEPRTRALRKVWATASAALFLVSETAAFFEGDIVRESCDHFEAWVKRPVAIDENDTSMSSIRSTTTVNVAQRDPETLAAAHRSFLSALIYALLLTDLQFARELRSLLSNIDALIAFFHALMDVQQNAAVNSTTSVGHDGEEHQRLSLELDRTRKKVDSDQRSVINRLRQLDHQRIGSARYLELDIADGSDFEPWKVGGVDRLLMKLEFGRMQNELERFDLV
jgi:hypothetical protein